MSHDKPREVDSAEAGLRSRRDLVGCHSQTNGPCGLPIPTSVEHRDHCCHEDRPTGEHFWKWMTSARTSPDRVREFHTLGNPVRTFPSSIYEVVDRMNSRAQVV